MNIKELLFDWNQHSFGEKESAKVCIQLPLKHLAHILALVDMFPNRSREQVIADLLDAALNELEALMPYVKGDKVVAEDEFGDPMYEDAGMTPRFLELSKEHLKQLKIKYKPK